MPYGKNKTTVPPREERLEALGDPQAPKMGRVSPKTVEVPEIDGLLKEMEDARLRRGRFFDFLRRPF